MQNDRLIKAFSASVGSKQLIAVPLAVWNSEEDSDDAIKLAARLGMKLEFTEESAKASLHDISTEVKVPPPHPARKGSNVSDLTKAMQLAVTDVAARYWEMYLSK